MSAKSGEMVSGRRR